MSSGDPNEPPPQAPIELKPFRSGRPMRLVQRESVARLVDHALGRALEALLPTIAHTQKALLLRERSRQEFLELLQSQGRRVRGMTRSRFLIELERSKNELLSTRDRVREELAGLVQHKQILSEFEEALERNQAEQHEAGAARDRELVSGIQALFGVARNGKGDPKALEESVITLALEAVRRERAGVQSEQSAEFDSRVELFERRIAKLGELLEQSERALAELARLKDVDPGIESIYRTVQGLARGDPHARAKREVLVQLFEANLALKAVISSGGRLEYE